MTNLKKEIARMMLEAGENIAKMIASESHQLWQRKDFRMYVDFDNLSQTEQDRIFNELEVSLIGLYVLRLDQALIDASEEKTIAFRGLKASIQEGFLKLLEDTGLENKHVKQWEKLIDIRLKEYRKDLKIALKESLNDPQFKGKDSDLRPTWARIETIMIDCLTHIRRGEIEENDPLWKFLRKWFITLDVRLTPLTKL